MSAPSQNQIENAIHAWVLAATGLAASKVVWRNQNGPRPARPFIVLSLGGVQEVATPWIQNQDTPSPAPPGEEITYSVRGVERLRVTFECFTDTTTGSSSAIDYLRLVRGKLNMPSIRSALWAAHVGVATFGDVLVLDFLENSAQQLGRAQMDCGIYVPTEFTERGTFIEFAEFDLTFIP